MSQNKIDILERALKREKLARKTAEKILEKKSSELYFLTDELKQTNDRLENLLNQKASQLKGVFNSTLDALIIIDLKGNVLEVNDTAINLIEHDYKEGSLNVLDLMDEEEKELGIKSFGELIKQGDFSGYTTKIKTKSNKILCVHINGSFIYNKKKEPIAAQGIIRNITEIKKYTALIEEQKRQLEIVVESSSLGIVLTQRGVVVMTNKSFQDHLGYSEEELYNRSVKEITFKEDYLVTKNHLEKMDARLINNFIIDKRYIKKNGGILWAKTNVNAVRDQYGEVKYEVAIIEDVTLEREKTLVIDMVNDVVKSILGKLDIYDIALEIINKIAKYLQAKNSVIYFVNHKNNTVEQIAWAYRKDNNIKNVNEIKSSDIDDLVLRKERII